MDRNALIVDLFAGGGGASIGIEAALGRHVDIAINHDPEAIAVHKANHPRTKHFTSDIWEVDPLVATEGRPVAFLHASPDCKHFSRAKGDVPKSKHIRAGADAVIDWAEKTQPLVITLENVSEFVTWGPLGPDGKAIKPLAGEYFDMWRAALVDLGYIVDHRVLDASEYGAPTKRKRFFMVARRDGQPISWPTRTHGAPGSGLKPLNTAAGCIDWSIPCPSIFERSKPLAKKTLARIAAGIERYVLNDPKPFVVTIDHRGSKPSDTAHSINKPLTTITSKNRHAVILPTLIQTGYGERPGQRPRSLNLHEPLGTVVAQGQKHALVATFIAKHFGGVVGIPASAPLSTITQRDHHSVVTANLIKFYGTSKAASVREPLPATTAQGNHAAVVETTLRTSHAAEARAFLVAYYGQGSGETGHRVDQPLPTITTKPRFGLVVIDGTEYEITDIGMRMVEPEELLRAQFGRFAEGYDMSAARTKAGKTKLVGNSVPPELEEALVAANQPNFAALAA